MNVIIKTVGLVAMPILAALIITGCEDRNTGADIAVTPQSTSLTGRGSVALTADDADGTIVYPLTWSVNNPALGSVIGSGGASAIYESNGKIGSQAVTVIDDTGREGVAVVEQM